MLLYDSNAKSILSYGSGCWRVVKADMRKLEAFHNGCLRRICHIFWPNKISNHHLHKKTDSQSITKEITHRRLRRRGHMLRMEQDRIPRVALRWTPPGKRKPRRPTHTWCSIVTQKPENMNLSWGEAQHAVKLIMSHLGWRGVSKYLQAVTFLSAMFEFCMNAQQRCRNLWDVLRSSCGAWLHYKWVRAAACFKLSIFSNCCDGMQSSKRSMPLEQMHDGRHWQLLLWHHWMHFWPAL